MAESAQSLLQKHEDLNWELWYAPAYPGAGEAETEESVHPPAGMKAFP